MKHVASFIRHCLIRIPWWAHGLFSLAAYGLIKGTVILLPSFTDRPLPLLSINIPLEIILFYPLFPLFFSKLSLRKQKKVLAGQEPISQLNTLNMASFSEAVVTRLVQCGFTVVSTQDTPCPNRETIKIIRNGEMHLLFLVRKDLISPKHIQEFTNILFTEGIYRGIVVSTGVIPCKRDIYSGNITLELLDGKTLLAFLSRAVPTMVNQALPADLPGSDRIRSLINARHPLCPVCQSYMDIDLGRNNGHSGKPYWKCTRRPECEGSVTFKLDTLQSNL